MRGYLHVDIVISEHSWYKCCMIFFFTRLFFKQETIPLTQVYGLHQREKVSRAYKTTIPILTWELARKMAYGWWVLDKSAIVSTSLIYIFLGILLEDIYVLFQTKYNTNTRSKCWFTYSRHKLLYIKFLLRQARKSIFLQLWFQLCVEYSMEPWRIKW